MGKEKKVSVTLRVTGEYEDYSYHIMNLSDFKKLQKFVKEFNENVMHTNIEIYNYSIE